MKKRFTEEQIIRILKAHEGGRSAKELCLEVSEAKRMRELEAENRKLKELVADLSLDNKILKEIVSKN